MSPAMDRRYVDLASESSRGLESLKKAGVAAIYSDAVRVDTGDVSFLYISGKIGNGLEGKIARSIADQTAQTLDNIRLVLEREGGTMDDIVRVRVYVTQLDEQSLQDVHRVRSRYFSAGKYPASTLVRVDQLVRDGALIEIDADAVLVRPKA